MKIKRQIPESEVRITFARSSGAGGQNVNKLSTKAIAHWKVGESVVFSSLEKGLIREKLKNRLNSDDEIVLMADDERSQPQNRSNVIERLNVVVNGALYVPKKRRPTRPTRSSKERRLNSKKKHSDVKVARKGMED